MDNQNLLKCKTKDGKQSIKNFYNFNNDTVMCCIVIINNNTLVVNNAVVFFHAFGHDVFYLLVSRSFIWNIDNKFTRFFLDGMFVNHLLIMSRLITFLAPRFNVIPHIFIFLFLGPPDKNLVIRSL